MFRLKEVGLYLPLIALGVSSVLGLRTALLNGSADQLERSMVLGIVGVSVVGLLIGAIHIVFGSPSPLERYRIHWKTTLVSSEVLAILVGTLYFFSGEAVLQITGSPIENPTPRLLLGLLDGFVYGGMIGLTISTIDRQATTFSRQGVTRYGTSFALLHVIAAIGFVVNQSSQIGEILSTPLVLVLIYMLRVWVRRRNQRPA